MSGKVKIVEEYYNYFPPVHVHGSVQLLLRYVPEQHLVGLRKVILTNSEYLQYARKGKITSEKRRVRPSDCLGLYQPGQIRLIMDRIFDPYLEIFLLVPFVKMSAIGEVLYHEIGHHIYCMEKRGYRDREEQVADEWMEKLMRTFMKQRYWYLSGIVRLLWPLLRRVQARLDGVPVEEEADPPADLAAAIRSMKIR